MSVYQVHNVLLWEREVGLCYARHHHRADRISAMRLGYQSASLICIEILSPDMFVPEENTKASARCKIISTTGRNNGAKITRVQLLAIFRSEPLGKGQKCNKHLFASIKSGLNVMINLPVAWCLTD